MLYTGLFWSSFLYCSQRCNFISVEVSKILGEFLRPQQAETLSYTSVPTAAMGSRDCALKPRNHEPKQILLLQVVFLSDFVIATEHGSVHASCASTLHTLLHNFLYFWSVFPWRLWRYGQSPCLATFTVLSESGREHRVCANIFLFTYLIGPSESQWRPTTDFTVSRTRSGGALPYGHIRLSVNHRK